MSHEYHRRGRNWYTAMGILFCVSAAVVIIRQLLIWGPEFVTDFLLNNEITNEKVSFAMLALGLIMVFIGFRKHEQKR